MKRLARIAVVFFSAAVAAPVLAAQNAQPDLPDWQVLEFEQKAFWATARSRLEILPVDSKPNISVLDVVSSVVDNSEKLQLTFHTDTGALLTRTRISSGKEQRMKSYQYEKDFILRERSNSPQDPNVPPNQWPVTNQKWVKYPANKGGITVTSPYMLMIIASQLQAQGPGNTKEVLVNTDLNFYRAKLTSGNGITVTADTKVVGGEAISGKRETVAVSIQVSPEGKLEDDDDFSLLGLQGDIIILFDRATGLPLQIRGLAPRIGSTEINLKSATMRAAQ
jgi:hypothetical protein